MLSRHEKRCLPASEGRHCRRKHRCRSVETHINGDAGKGGMGVVTSGSEAIDALIDGGFESGIISTVYGPSGSGKTNVVLLTAVRVAEAGKKVVFIDTEGGYSVERLRQLCDDSEKVLKNIMFLQPTDYKEQKKTISTLMHHMNDKVGLVVVDSIAMLYRLEMAEREPVEVNRELGAQMSYLVQIARRQDIPVLVTTQVYSMFDDREKVMLSGGDLIKYASKCLVELRSMRNGRRRAILRKHRYLPEEKDVYFEIVGDGLKKVTPGRSFALFG
jgi:DNA repair protein RadB